jgi:LmbE family N-acetylglucosaminyl deacetylase
VLVERALYLSGIHGYAAGGDAWKVRVALMYSGRREVRPDVVVDVSDVYDVKRRAIEAHATQFGGADGAQPTPLNAPGFLELIEARDRTHGHYIGVRYGEALQSSEPLPMPDLGLLLRPRGER